LQRTARCTKEVLVARDDRIERGEQQVADVEDGGRADEDAARAIKRNRASRPVALPAASRN
jgi:hypothetical protein